MEEVVRLIEVSLYYYPLAEQNNGILHLAVPMEAYDRILSESVS